MKKIGPYVCIFCSQSQDENFIELLLEHAHQTYVFVEMLYITHILKLLFLFKVELPKCLPKQAR